MTWFSDREIRRLAGERSYARGRDYVAAIGEVHDLPNGVTATVHGSLEYRVRLRNDGGLTGECSCPYGREGNFCKHCVAVGLHLLTPIPGQRTTGRGGRRSQPVDVRQYLGTLEREELVTLIWEHAQDDPVLFQRLQLATATRAEVPDLGLLRTQVERLDAEWLSYEDTYLYVRNAQSVIDALAGMAASHARQVQPLLRRALSNIGSAAGVSEDEDGTIIEVAEAAWRHYLDACRAAPPDPAELGSWFLDFQVDGPEWPEVALEDISGLLGEQGLAAYRAALDKASRSRANHWRIRSLREELVAATGDTDALIACLAEDLANPHQFVRIATVLRDEGRIGEAIEWLERGRHDGSDQGYAGAPLVDLLCDLYLANERPKDALALRQQYFGDHLNEQTYARLREAAETLGTWDAVGPKAHALLRRKAREGEDYVADTLARILLSEDDPDAAWRVVRKHLCREETLLAAAAQRAKAHPADAIAVYRPIVDRCVGQVNNYGYEQAAGYLLTLRKLFARTGDDFSGYLAGLRETHRRKRNLLAELDRRGLP